jgi:hypothetical protein
VDVFIRELAGFAVWLVANGVWLGFPVTWISLLVVKEGSQPRVRPPPDDVRSLLHDIQRDRALRAGDPPDPDRDESSEEET